MPDGTAKKTRYTFNFGRLKIFIVVAVLIYTLVALSGQQETLTKQIQRQEELTRSQAELEQRVEYYANELDYIGTDEYVEQEARTRFGWLMPGEIKYLEGSGAVVSSSAVSSGEGTDARDSRAAASSPGPSASRTASGAAATSSPSASRASASPSAGPSASAASSEPTAVPTTESGETISPEMANSPAYASHSRPAAED